MFLKRATSCSFWFDPGCSKNEMNALLDENQLNQKQVRSNWYVTLRFQNEREYFLYSHCSFLHYHIIIQVAIILTRGKVYVSTKCNVETKPSATSVHLIEIAEAKNDLFGAL